MPLILLTMVDSDDEKDHLLRLYEKYNNYLLYIAFDMLRDKDLADDAVSDAFMRLIRSGKHTMPVESERTRFTLAVILRNIVRDIQRKNNREKELLPQLYAVPLKNETTNPVAARLQKALLMLDEDKQNLLLLRYEQNYSYEEIAKMNGITEVSARKRVNRAKQALEKVMKELEEEDSDHE